MTDEQPSVLVAESLLADESECSSAEKFIANEGLIEEPEYGETNRMSFQDLLKIHHTQTVWGFKFGKEVMASTLARDRCRQEQKIVTDSQCTPDTTKYLDQPSTSKTESDHKTPHSHRTKERSSERTSKRKSTSRRSDFVSPQKTRRAPLPLMNWADSKEVWLFMVYKEEASLNLRNPRLFEDFTNFMPRMRAILLDWLMEVCEVYHLRRVTYYLAVDYFDRFLSIRPDVPKNQLQLVGVTCLFIAAKLEEIYPPRLTEFSYVCDGACTCNDILSCELLILNSLGWDLNIMTPSDWLNLYMQIHFQAQNVAKRKLPQHVNREFIFPQYSGYQFTRASQLLDICSLDPGFLKFSYSIIAAAAMYFMYGKKSAMIASGLSWSQLQPCCEYMAVFYHVIRDSPDPRLQSCKSDSTGDDQPVLESIRQEVKDLIKDENHSLQTHVVNMEYFERSVMIRLEQMGLKVERTYVPKHSPEKQKSPTEESTEETKDCGSNSNNLVCMYDIEKLTCEAAVLSDSDISVSPSASPDANLILTDDKGLLSFDEILDGIVKCNRKNIPLNLQTSHELLEDALKRLD